MAIEFFILLRLAATAAAAPTESIETIGRVQCTHQFWFLLQTLLQRRTAVEIVFVFTASSSSCFFLWISIWTFDVCTIVGFFLSVGCVYDRRFFLSVGCVYDSRFFLSVGIFVGCWCIFFYYLFIDVVHTMLSSRWRPISWYAVWYLLIDVLVSVCRCVCMHQF